MLDKRKFLILISLVSVIFLFFVVIGYLKTKQNIQKSIKSLSTPTTSREVEEKIVESLFPDKYFYLQLFYPKIYVYNLNQSVVQTIDLETKESKDLYKVTKLTKARLSNNQEKLLFYTTRTNHWYLLNFSQNELFKFSSSVRDAVFVDQTPLLVLKDKKSSLALFTSNGIKKLIDLDLQNPSIVPLSSKQLLIFETQKPSQVFLLDLSQPSKLKIFLEKEDNYSILTQGNLIFLSSSQGSQILDLDKKIIKNFGWQVYTESCSLEDFLICGLDNFKIFIYDLKNQKGKEINLENNFEVRYPHLTPLGLIFWNGLDSQFYIINSEKISL